MMWVDWVYSSYSNDEWHCAGSTDDVVNSDDNLISGVTGGNFIISGKSYRTISGK